MKVRSAFDITYFQFRHRTSHLIKQMSMYPEAELLMSGTVIQLHEKTRTHEAILGRLYSCVWKSATAGYQKVVLLNPDTNTTTTVHLSSNRMREKTVFITETPFGKSLPTVISFGFHGYEHGYAEFRDTLFINPNKRSVLTSSILNS